MTTQIAVRLPDELVGYVDELVRAGAASRAAVVIEALEAHHRRVLAERDAAILTATGDYEDLVGLRSYGRVDPDLD